MSSGRMRAVVKRAVGNPLPQEEVFDIAWLRSNPDWQAAEVLRINRPLGIHKGPVPPTEIRLLWDDGAIYAAYWCEDKRITSVTTEHNGPVYKDSCVEFFVAPDVSKPKEYCNIEMNCARTTLTQNHCPSWWKKAKEWQPGLGIASTVPGPTKEASPDDREWALIVRIPFSAFAGCANGVPPKDGTEWRANFQRCWGDEKKGGIFLTWAPIPKGINSFHRPEAFGTIVFSGQAVR